MTELAKSDAGYVARPLRVLIPLIHDDLKQARDAAERAGLPYYRAAGEKMLEAKPQILHGQFRDWIKRNFGISYQHATQYMGLAKSSRTQDFSSLSDFVRQTSSPTYNLPHTVRPPSWHEPVKQIVDRVDTETLNRAREEMKRADERDAQRKLALQLIDIGYKVLARTLHPDKGGSREAMVRLNAVRDRLKQSV